MQIRDDNVSKDKHRADDEGKDDKRGFLAGVFRAVKILAFFVVLVAVFVVSVMIVAMASGAKLGTCSSGSHNPIV